MLEISTERVTCLKLLPCPKHVDKRTNVAVDRSASFIHNHDAFINCSQAAEEKAAEAAGRARELYEENKRLEDHIHDLETRKRAPLYQKKQEEELKAAVEKAQDAEIRAAEAELKCKEAKVCTQAPAECWTHQLTSRLV